MNPFAYPKSKHTRREQPGPYATYQRYKPALRREFREKCVYCCRPDGGLHQDFGVDHYRPKSRFPELNTSYPNLFYTCNSCNRRKGKFWPTEEQLQANQFIPNPCDHEMFQHLRYHKSVVEARSVAGEYTLRLLDLNNPPLTSYREATLVTIDATESKRREAADLLKRFVELRASGAATGSSIDSAIAKTEFEIGRLDTALRTLTGE